MSSFPTDGAMETICFFKPWNGSVFPCGPVTERLSSSGQRKQERRKIADYWPLGSGSSPATDRHSAVIRKQLDWVVEAAHRIFTDAFEIEIAFDALGERAGQQHRSPQLFGEGFETRSHVDRRTDDGEIQPAARPDIAVHDVSDVDTDAVIQRRTTGFAVLFVQGNHGLTRFGDGMQQISAGRWLAE